LKIETQNEKFSCSFVLRAFAISHFFERWSFLITSPGRSRFFSLFIIFYWMSCKNHQIKARKTKEKEEKIQYLIGQ